MLKKLFRNILVQYSFLTLVIIVVLSILLGTTLSRKITDHLIHSHINLYPKIINLIISRDARTSEFLTDFQSYANRSDIAGLFSEILNFGNIFRVKVWDVNGTILWSDRYEAIGKNFKTNPHFQTALGGQVNYEISKPEEPENFSEKNKKSILEIYIPVINDGKVIGVFEIYEADQELYERISRNMRIVWLLVFAFGGLLYCCQFWIFYRAYRLQQRTYSELSESHDVTIFALAYQAELRDLETGRHLDRTAAYVRILAEELKRHPDFRAYLSREYIRDLVKSAPLHDIGKTGVPDAILRKPGPLTDDEFAEMMKHCELGARILKKAEKKLSVRSFLTIAIQLTMSHHEKWNGKGYPFGLKGNEIPLSGRIMALADVYDALRSERVYKESFPHEKCISIIKKERGEHFDPAVVDAFLKQEKVFRKISEELQD